MALLEHVGVAVLMFGSVAVFAKITESTFERWADRLQARHDEKNGGRK